MDLAALSGILHGRAGFFEHTPTVTSTYPTMPSRWGFVTVDATHNCTLASRQSPK